MDLRTNPKASLTFWWEPLQRQVRIEGTTERLSVSESQEYYSTRPRGSQLGAWASPQSTVIESREALEKLYKQSSKDFKDQEVIPCPPFWGGLRIIPNYVEFWQGRVDRLGDRFVYTLTEENIWKLDRLSP